MPNSESELSRGPDGLSAEHESHEDSNHPPTSRFHHERLQHAAASIRLLKLVAETKSSDMSFELRAWPIDKAPKYNAISYTWGEETTRTIEINGQALRIRLNCCEALRQAVNYDAETYLWIDSICIDQENLVEKSEQVHGMYKIYRNAMHVLGCIGRHADESEQLQQYCILMLGSDEKDMVNVRTPSTQLPTLDLPEIAMAFAKSTDRESIANLRRIAVAFANRPYWNRLWIVQEILAGSHSVRILYGDTFLSWRQISTMVEVVQLLTPVSNKQQLISQSPLRKLMHIKAMCEFYGGTVRLSQLLQGLSETGCTDPRDRIYGLLAIIDWKSMNLVPIVPDYERTAWSLAVELTSGLGAQSCSLVMSMLQIGSHVPEMQALIQERSSPFFVMKERDGETLNFDFGEVTATRLFEDDCGNLRLGDDTGWRSRSEDDATFLESYELMISSETGPNTARKPRKVYFNSQAVVLVCSNTLPGDCIITSLAWKRLCFICRPAQDDVLDVIGTGILFSERDGRQSHNTLSSGRPGERVNDTQWPLQFQAGLHISTTPEDVMLFFHMDAAAEKTCEQADVQLRILPLRPVLASRSAARLIAYN